MNCKEFNELSEPYLSDELLVETNLQVHRHLESCPSCRRDFSDRKTLRANVRAAVVGSDDFRIDPQFSARLSDHLRESAIGTSRRPYRESSWWPMLPAVAVAGLLLVVAIALIQPILVNDVPVETSFVARFAELSAVDHKDCAVDKIDMWETQYKNDGGPETESGPMVVQALATDFPDLEIVSEHDCLFDGKNFVHVILRLDGRLVSFYKERDLPGRGLGQPHSFASASVVGFHVARFDVGSHAFSVVSGLPVDRNKQVAQNIARVLSQNS